MVSALAASSLIAAALFTSFPAFAADATTADPVKDTEGSVSVVDVVRGSLTGGSVVEVRRSEDRMAVIDFNVPRQIARAAATDVFHALDVIGGPEHPLNVSHQETTGVMLIRGDAETVERARSYIEAMVETLRRAYEIEVELPGQPVILLTTTSSLAAEMEYREDTATENRRFNVSAVPQRVNKGALVVRLSIQDTTTPLTGPEGRRGLGVTNTLHVPMRGEETIESPLGLITVRVRQVG